MTKLNYLILILIYSLLIGCAFLFTEQEYLLIDQPVTEKPIFHGVIFSIPDKVNVRKIRLLGVGKYHDIQISVRVRHNRWELKKVVRDGITFPYEILLSAETDAIKIIKPTTTGSGRIDTVEFYTIRDKNVEHITLEE